MIDDPFESSINKALSWEDTTPCTKCNITMTKSGLYITDKDMNKTPIYICGSCGFVCATYRVRGAVEVVKIHVNINTEKT